MGSCTNHIKTLLAEAEMEFRLNQEVNLVNLTPHAVTLIDEFDNKINLPASGQVARISESSTKITSVNHVPIMKTIYGEVDGLPEPKPNTLYIVSALIATRIRRNDVVCPDTGPTAVRENGQIVAVRALKTFN